MIWVTRTLGDICDQVNGIIRTGPFGSQLHQSDYQDEGLPVVMPKDIVDAKISVEGIARIGEKDVERLSQHRLQKGDIVYGRRGDIGRRALINDREAGWLCGTGCLRISLGDSIINPIFLYYYLGESKVIAWIYNQAVGATLANLNTTIIRSIPITYPPLPTQKKITGILSAYDDLIENNTRRIKILEEMAQTLYHEWFVKFRFPGHEHIKMVDSELGLIPEGWEVKKLGNYIKTQKGFAFKSQWYQDSGVPLVKVSNFTEDSIDTQNLICISEEIAQQYKKHKLDSNDIIIQTVGSWASNPKSVVGKVIRVPRQAQKSLLNQNAVKLIPEIPLNETFLYYLLKRNDFKNYIIGCAQGAASQASITLDSIREFKFLLPSIELLNSFYNLTYSIWELVNNLSIKNISISQTRDLLLPKLISGEIDVEHLEITTEDIAA